MFEVLHCKPNRTNIYHQSLLRWDQYDLLKLGGYLRKSKFWQFFLAVNACWNLAGIWPPLIIWLLKVFSHIKTPTLSRNFSVKTWLFFELWSQKYAKEYSFSRAFLFACYLLISSCLIHKTFSISRKLNELQPLPINELKIAKISLSSRESEQRTIFWKHIVSSGWRRNKILNLNWRVGELDQK